MIAPKLRFKADDGNDFPDWEEKKINDIATCFAGATPSTKIPEYWEDGTIQWMSSGEVNNGQIFETEKRISKLGFDKCSTKMVKPNTVVIALAGQGKTRGMVAITRTSLCTNQSLCAIETTTDICDDYLYQYLQLQYNNLRLISSGDGTRGGLNLKLIGNYSVSIPSLSEQQKIADFLSTIDTIIEKQRATVSAWEERKKSVMQKLFSQEVRFKADDGSDFPDWEEKRLGDMVEFINGRAYKQDELLASGKYIVLRVGNLFTNDSYYYSDLELDEDKYIEDGNLIYAWSATFGPKIYHGDKCIYHYHIWKLKFDENAISKMFLNYYLQHDVEKIKSKRTGGTMVHITKNAMEHRELEFPSLPEQQKIADCLSALDTVIQKQKETLEKWQELKKGLLQQMFV